MGARLVVVLHDPHVWIALLALPFSVLSSHVAWMVVTPPCDPLVAHDLEYIAPL